MLGIANIIPEIAQKVETYSAVDLLTIIGAIGVLIGTITTSIITIISTLRNGQKIDTVKEAVAGTDGLIAKVDEIHTLTNANLTRSENKNEVLLIELKAIRDEVTELKSERSKREIETATAIPIAPYTIDKPKIDPTTPPVIVVENVTAENVTAKNVKTDTLTTGSKK